MIILLNFLSNSQTEEISKVTPPLLYPAQFSNNWSRLTIYICQTDIPHVQWDRINTTNVNTIYELSRGGEDSATSFEILG